MPTTLTCLGLPGFSTQRPVSRGNPHSQANQEGWAPYRKLKLRGIGTSSTTLWSVSTGLRLQLKTV